MPFLFFFVSALCTASYIVYINCPILIEKYSLILIIDDSGDHVYNVPRCGGRTLCVP
jgi:hypothetical protein